MKLSNVVGVFFVLLIIFVSTSFAGYKEGKEAFDHGNHTKALEELRPLAEKGDLSSQQMIGDIYEIEGNLDEAMKWFRKAGDQGDTHSLIKIGKLYYFGSEKVKRDLKEASRYFGIAADQGDPEAQYYMGELTGGKESFTFYMKSAEQGYVPAFSALGLIYGNGSGVTKDQIESAKWLLLTGFQGKLPVPLIMQALEKNMTAAQIDEATIRAKKWKPTKLNPDIHFANRFK